MPFQEYRGRSERRRPEIRLESRDGKRARLQENEERARRMKHGRYFAWIFTRLANIKHAAVP